MQCSVTFNKYNFANVNKKQINLFGDKIQHRVLRFTPRMVRTNSMIPMGKQNSRLYNKKNLALSGIFFTNLMSYTIIRDLKDVIFITDCGASLIPFVNTWVNLPFSFIFILLYNFLLNKYTFRKTYLITYIFLSTLYGGIGLYLYPLRELLLIQSSSVLISNWVSLLYYVLSPIWGTIVVSVLFWSFANQYTEIEDAKTIYPIMGIIANIALVLAGIVMNTTGSILSHDWNLNVQILTLVHISMSIVSIMLFIFVINNYKTVRTYKPQDKHKSNKKHFQSLLALQKNPFVRHMVIMISSYGLLIGFYESIWKHYLEIYLITPIKYSQFMGTVSSITGILTIVMMICGSVWMKTLSWTGTALLTPLSMFGLGVLFYSSILSNSLQLISLTGAGLTIFVKGAKYALFDPCKEIAYIPMDDDIKTKGKANIEILCAPFGKSFSNFVLQLLMITCGSIEASVPIIGILYLMTCGTWVHSTIFMGELIEKNKKID